VAFFLAQSPSGELNAELNAWLNAELNDSLNTDLNVIDEACEGENPCIWTGERR
jgi:hypothetical protein